MEKGKDDFIFTEAMRVRLCDRIDRLRNFNQHVSDIVCASDLSDTEKWFKLGQFYARNQNEIEKLAGLHDDIYEYNI